MAQFADRHATEREPVFFSKTLKLLDRLDHFRCGWGRLELTGRNWRSSGALEQTGGIRINPYALRGRLASEFRLKLGCDFNGDGHQPPLFTLDPGAALLSSQESGGT